MSTEIIQWKQLYRVVFKDEETTDKLISPDIYNSIKKDLFENRWVEIDGELYNPFEIRKIVKYKTQDGIMQLIQNEKEYIQVKVREYMRTYKKELTIGVVENMIKKAKGIEI